MSVISKCKFCDKPVPPNNPILIDDANNPYRLCSLDCMNQYYEQEAAADLEAEEWSALCAKAIKLGEAESGRKFEDAGDALIDSWIVKYAINNQNSVSDN